MKIRWMQKIWQNRHNVGSALGLLLVMCAFAYRWHTPFMQLMREHSNILIGTVDEEGAIKSDMQIRYSSLENAEPMEVKDSVRIADKEIITAAAQPPSMTSAEIQAKIDEALIKARDAREQMQFILPSNQSALYWYEVALELDANHEEVRQEKHAVLQAAIQQAHAAIDAADNKLVDELLAELAESGAEQGQFDLLTQRRAIMSQVSSLLRDAARLLDAGQVDEDSGNQNALSLYQQVLALDHLNARARQGLARIQQIYYTRALAFASENKFLLVDEWLKRADAVLPHIETERPVLLQRILSLREAYVSRLLANIQVALDAKNMQTVEALLSEAQQLGVGDTILQSWRDQQLQAQIYQQYKPGETFSDPFMDRDEKGPVLVVLPVGEFFMGASKKDRQRKRQEEPEHKVQLPAPRAMARTEITVAQFRRFVRDTNYQTESEKLGNSMIYDEKNGRMRLLQGVTWRDNYIGEKAKNQDPVMHVSWHDAQAYTEWLTEHTGHQYRLPTEAEFEYVLRAGSATNYWWGNGEPTQVLGNFTGDKERSSSRRSWAKAFANYNDGYWGPAPVAQFTPNPFGVFDIDGNLSEWVEDCWHDNYRRAPDDGSAWINKGCDKRVVRGGSWASEAEQFRSAYRISARDDTRGSRVGFRVVREFE